MTPSEAINAAHQRPPRNLAEALTEACLFGYDLEERDVGRRMERTGPTLRERIETYWGVERQRAPRVHEASWRRKQRSRL